MTTQSNTPVNKSDDEPVFGLSDLFNIFRFVLHAVLRHKIIVIICIILVVAAAYGVIKILPRTYRVTTEILVHPSSTISTLASTGRRVDRDELLIGISQMMKSRSNMEGIVDETDLVKLRKTTRTSSQKFIDDKLADFFGPPTDEQIREGLIGKIDKNVWVEIRYLENVIVITVEWDHPWIAQQIQKVLINRFLEERRALEMSEINDTIKLLETKYDAARAQLEKIAEANKSMISKTETLESRETRTYPHTVSAPRQRRTSTAAQPALSDKQRKEYDLANEELETIEAEIARLKENHAQRLASEQQELSQLRNTVGPQHPERIERERYVELLSKQSPVPASLRQKKISLEAFIEQIENQIAAAEAPKATVSHPPRRPRPQATDEQANETDVPESSGELEFESQVISEEYSAMSQTVNGLGTRLANARMALTASEAAFAYRYHLTRPPEFPKRPAKPKKLQLMIMALALSIFLGIFMAVFVDLRSGIILESWQVEKIANVPLLGEIKEQ